MERCFARWFTAYLLTTDRPYKRLQAFALRALSAGTSLAT